MRDTRVLFFAIERASRFISKFYEGLINAATRERATAIIDALMSDPFRIRS